MRVAHVDRRRVSHRSRLEVEMQCVHWPRQLDIRPVEPSWTHIDAHPAVGQRLRRQVAGHRADHLDATPGLARQQIDHAAGGVAAGPASAPSGLRMRMKASAVEPSGAGSMAMNWSHPTPGASIGDRRGARGGEAQRTGAFVENDEVVAAAMHLEEARHTIGYMRRRGGGGRGTSRP